jgi:hypothetical protein
MRAVFHSDARLELAEAARWYNSQSPGLGGNLRRWLDWYARYDRYLYGAVASPTLGGKNIYLVDNSGYAAVALPPIPAGTTAGMPAAGGQPGDGFR